MNHAFSVSSKLASFNFSRKQLGTVSAWIIIFMPYSNERAHEVINKNLFPRNFKVSKRARGRPATDSCSLIHVSSSYASKRAILKIAVFETNSLCI